MADSSITLDAGSGGSLVATFDDGTKHHQYILLEYWDGTANQKVAVATPLPVELRDNGNTVVADIAAIKTAVQLIDDAISGTEMQVDVVASLPAGTNVIGKVDINSLPNEGQQTKANSISVAIASDQDDLGVKLKPQTSGGLTLHKAVSAASTNATSVKGSAGQVYGIQCFNVNANEAWLKLYNKASAPTVGTDVPVKTLAIPGSTEAGGFVVTWEHGLAFSAGIAYAITTGPTDGDTGAVAANEVVVNIDYK